MNRICITDTTFCFLHLVQVEKMARFKGLKLNTFGNEIDPSGPVPILNVKWHGSKVVEVTWRDGNEKNFSEWLSQDQEYEADLTGCVRTG
jgi:hypothetical protein